MVGKFIGELYLQVIFLFFFFNFQGTPSSLLTNNLFDIMLSIANSASCSHVFLHCEMASNILRQLFAVYGES